ncbi:MAG: peptidase [Bacteroidetes bacterium]|nr:peptidase [Bacteroidota bacterium]
MPDHVLFVFLDGVGLGAATADNPFATLDLPGFAALTQGHSWTRAAPTIDTEQLVVRPLDATLGVDGLPQSGTGQATLFTGRNGAQLAGRHYGPFPHSKTRPALAQHSIFRQVQQRFPDAPEPTAFANAYPDRFFRYAARRDRWTVTTRCCLDADVRIRTAEDMDQGHALPADLTAEGWRRFDDTVPLITEAEAARRLAQIARQHRFTLFEYFLTDKAGHSRDADRAARVLTALDRFFSALRPGLADDLLLIVTSDHGNLEDLSRKTHTRNPVPLVARGPGAPAFTDAASIQDVTPGIVRALA